MEQHPDPGKSAIRNPQFAIPPVPHSFLEYLRSFGPGIVIVLTWLGAGDVVDMGVAGSNYGYSLMWVLVVALLLRFLLVSLIARYQLCNQHGEGVLDGLARLHRWYAPGLLVAVIVMGHVYGSYMTVGAGEVCRNLFRAGETWQWALLCNGVALALVLRSSYQLLEWVFKGFLALLAISFVGSAIWVGFNPLRVLEGLYSAGDARAAREVRLAAGRGGDDRGCRRLSDESGVSVLSGGEGLARPAVSPSPVLRFSACDSGNDRAQPLGLDSWRGVTLS